MNYPMDVEGISGAICESKTACYQEVESTSVLAKLEQRRLQLQTKLAENASAIKFINEHPEFVQFMDIVGKALRY